MLEGVLSNLDGSGLGSVLRDWTEYLKMYLDAIQVKCKPSSGKIAQAGVTA